MTLIDHGSTNPYALYIETAEMLVEKADTFV